jgi:hypothetical protein
MKYLVVFLFAVLFIVVKADSWKECATCSKNCQARYSVSEYPQLQKCFKVDCAPACDKLKKKIKPSTDEEQLSQKEIRVKNKLANIVNQLQDLYYR